MKYQVDAFHLSPKCHYCCYYYTHNYCRSPFCSRIFLDRRCIYPGKHGLLGCVGQAIRYLGPEAYPSHARRALLLQFHHLCDLQIYRNAYCRSCIARHDLWRHNAAGHDNHLRYIQYEVHLPTFHGINGSLSSKSMLAQLILVTGKEHYTLDFYRQFGQLLEALALSLAVH